jgi:phage tail sheath protein FI
MPTLTYPGVYIQEVSSGVRPIEAASTSTAAFVGLAEMGPSEAQLITNWTEFQRYFGGYLSPGTGYLAYSVFQFFNNGGRQCYIVRAVPTDAKTADVTVKNRANPAADGITFSAKNAGNWGNFLFLQIEDGTNDPGNEFKLSLRRETDAGVIPPNAAALAPLEVFDNLSMDPNAANYVATVLANNSNYLDAKIPDANAGAFQPGTLRGGVSPSLPLGQKQNFQISLDGDGFQLVALNGLDAETDPAKVATAIQTAVQVLTPKKAGTPAAAFTGFTCTVVAVGSGQALLLQSGSTAATSSVRVQAAATNDASMMLKIDPADALVSDGRAVQRPANAAAVGVGMAVVADPISKVTQGSDGTPPKANAETFFEAAFAQLNAITDFSLLAVPGEGTPDMVSRGMQYCANRPLQDVFYIGEVASSDITVDNARTFRSLVTSPNSYGAVYFPWLRAADPTGQSTTPILLPPSGYIAGLYARIDSSRGVWKAPAGTEASLNGTVGLAVDLDDTKHGVLNPLGIDVIRRFAAAGIVSFGARTISSDAEWKYVPVRRMAIMLRVSIYYGIQWAVFEPNDEPLWSQLRLNIGSFMTTLFRQGAFQGSTPSQAFFVKCDAETTTQADIDLGIVNILVGFAPLKPAEFVVVRLSQKAGQAS